MSSSAVVRRRIESAESLGDVVDTMKSLASVRVHQYRRTMRALDASTLTLDRAARALLRLRPELAIAAGAAAGERTITVVFGSDRGLCGPFNDRLARYAIDAVNAQSDVADAGESGVRIVTSGRRVARRLRAAGLTPVSRLAAPSSLGSLETAVAELLAVVERYREQGSDDRVQLIYARPVGATRFEPRTVQVLPVDPAWMRGLAERPWETRKLPMELSDPLALVRGLIRQRLALAFVKAYGSSLAAENAARLMAMEAASKNVEERLGRLRSEHQAARQAAVTAELLDIQSAADALA